MTRFYRWLVAVMMAVVASPAAAELERFAPAYPNFPLLGPGKAKGAVIYNHGKDSQVEPKGTIPPYVDHLRRAGWDVFRLIRPAAEDRVYDSTQVLVQRLKELKAQGYGRLASVGQSYGGWIGFAAAGERAGMLDAVVATAPAAFGKIGESNQWRRNGEIAGLASEVKGGRIMAFFFSGDDYDPGGRAAEVARELAAKGLMHAVIDNPEGLRGHGAAAGATFARLYGACVAAFLEAPPAQGPFACPRQVVDLAAFKLPDDVAVDAVDTTPEPVRAFVGKWVGTYDNGRPAMLVIERATGETVTGIYAWAPRPGRDEQPGFERISGTLDGTTLRFPNQRRVLNYSLRADGGLDARWARGDGSEALTTILNKVETTTPR